MVRGDPSCPSFCTVCKLDCRCQAEYFQSRCGKCHTCWEKARRDGTPFVPVKLDCVAYSHDCGSRPQKFRELEAQRKTWTETEKNLRDRLSDGRKLKNELNVEIGNVKKELSESQRDLKEEREKARALREMALKNVKILPTLFQSGIIEVVVGKSSPPQRRFIPKDVLTTNAEYFKSLFSFRERVGGESGRCDNMSNAGHVVILDTDVDRPEAFDCFIQFVYWGDYFMGAAGLTSGSAPRVEAVVDSTSSGSAAPSSSETSQLDLDPSPHIQVYVLAERLQAAPLKDLALRKASSTAVEIIKHSKTEALGTTFPLQTTLPDLIEDVYLNTPPAQKLERMRNLISALSAYFIDDLKGIERFQECLRNFSDFAVDLITHVRSGKELEINLEGYLKTE